MNYNDFINSLDSNIEVTNQVALGRLRYWRNEELKRTDWRMVEDATWDKTAWATYRQQLRDLPTTVSNPSNLASVVTYLDDLKTALGLGGN